MTRGRKKDNTIPPTRALTLQRDYRARKSQYVADLEARCKKAEEENIRLRKELDLARQGIPQANLSPEAMQASVHLRDTLAAASASLSHFMRVGLPSDSGMHTHPPSYTSPLESLSSAASAQSRAEETLQHDVLPADECCGGYIDCEGLVEDDEAPQDDGHQLSRNMAISQLRSTSGATKSPDAIWH
ncbi:hypothetical protein B0H15DRAFT_52706 [Mycena belliarum]|uniref:BZIP domain-containing protein n=1 Tax=Mycena belliarum TaxID=1033014 RepID=A0AAD6XSM3_9AGAR|nr:hypothetical protein B0H15DRAFT_52706 [Mycena belliae]